MTLPPDRPTAPVWQALTPDQRQTLLRALGRLLARRLPATPGDREVGDDRT